MTTDGSQQNHIEFLKCVIVVTFTEVIRVVADWMWDFDLFVNFVYQILSLGIFLFKEYHKTLEIPWFEGTFNLGAWYQLRHMECHTPGYSLKFRIGDVLRRLLNPDSI